MSEANLNSCNLTGANFTGTDLRLANLSVANLTRVNFGETNLTGANLEGANLEFSVFIQTNLTRANLSGVNLANAFIRDANISETIWNTPDPIIAELDAKLSEYQNERAGIVVIDSLNGETTISFNIEESEDLKNWQTTGEKITKTIQLKDGKKFYRFALDK